MEVESYKKTMRSTAAIQIQRKLQNMQKKKVNNPIISKQAKSISLKTTHKITVLFALTENYLQKTYIYFLKQFGARFP